MPGVHTCNVCTILYMFFVHVDANSTCVGTKQQPLSNTGYDGSSNPDLDGQQNNSEILQEDSYLSQAPNNSKQMLNPRERQLSTSSQQSNSSGKLTFFMSNVSEK